MAIPRYDRIDDRKDRSHNSKIPNLGLLQQLIRARIKLEAEQNSTVIQCKEREVTRAFYKYLQNQESNIKEYMENEFKNLEAFLATEEPEDFGGDSKHIKSYSASKAYHPGKDNIVQFFVVLPEELRHHDDIDIRILRYSKDCDVLLNFIRNDDGVFRGQCKISSEKFHYIYVISYGGWSVLEWVGDRLKPRIWDTNDHQVPFVFDGAILCDPDCNMNEVRMRGLLSMLPMISHNPSLASNTEIEEWIMTVCYQQQRLLEDIAAITSDNYLYKHYKYALESRWKNTLAGKKKIKNKLPSAVTFLYISSISVDDMLRMLNPLNRKCLILLSIVLRLLSKSQVLDLLKSEKLDLPTEELIAIAVYIWQTGADGDTVSLACLGKSLLRHIESQFSSSPEGVKGVPRESIKPVIMLLLLLIEEGQAFPNFELGPIQNQTPTHPISAYLRTILGEISAITDRANIEYWMELFKVKSDHTFVQAWWSAFLSEQFDNILQNVSEANLAIFVNVYKELPVKDVMAKIVINVAFDRLSKEGLQKKQQRLEEPDNGKTLGTEAKEFFYTPSSSKNKESEIPMLYEDSVSESSPWEGSHYEFDTIRETLKRWCDEVGARNVIIMNFNRLAECTLIGENISYLGVKIKEDEYLRLFNITLEEYQGESRFFLPITVWRNLDYGVKCELMLRDAMTNCCFALLPAHSFVEEHFINNHEMLSTIEGQKFKITFHYPGEDPILAEDAPRLFFSHIRSEDGQSIASFDIAAVKVNWRFGISPDGNPIWNPKILNVNEYALEYMKHWNVEVFLKESDATGSIGHRKKLDGSADEDDGYLWVKFNKYVLKQGDCGTIISVKDRDGNEYMLSMLARGYQNSNIAVYGTTILSYNLEKLCGKISDEKFTRIVLEVLVQCDQNLLDSLRRKPLSKQNPSQGFYG